VLFFTLLALALFLSKVCTCKEKRIWRTSLLGIESLLIPVDPGFHNSFSFPFCKQKKSTYLSMSYTFHYVYSENKYFLAWKGKFVVMSHASVFLFGKGTHDFSFIPLKNWIRMIYSDFIMHIRYFYIPASAPIVFYDLVWSMMNDPLSPNVFHTFPFQISPMIHSRMGFSHILQIYTYKCTLLYAYLWIL
jgi:hypothetical protein